MLVEGAKLGQAALISNRASLLHGSKESILQQSSNNGLVQKAVKLAMVPASLQKVYFGSNWVDPVKKSLDIDKSKALIEEIDFSTYWNRTLKNPKIVQNSVQRIYDMIMDAGTETKIVDGREVTTYNFFEKPSNPKNALIGMERVLDEFVQYLHQSAMGTKAKERLIVFVGGPGSAKSSLVRMIKKGLEDYTKTPKGELYALKWVNLPQDEASLNKIRNPKEREYFKKLGHEFADPLRVDPIYVLPQEMLGELNKEVNEEAKKAGTDYSIQLEGELSPPSLWIRDKLLEIYDHDITKVVESHVKAKRMVISEHRRIGVGTFAAGDEKSLDKTQLAGGVNFTRLADYDGDESNPMAYDFHTGELFIGNRGIMETIEGLKLPEQFLFEFFGLAQERTVKPDKQPLVTLDTTVIVHANKGEYEMIKDSELMKAFPSRMRLFKTPYPTNLKAEEKIYEKDYLPIAKERGVHVAPHALEALALWAVTTRLLKPVDGNIRSLVGKAKAYAGKEVGGYTPVRIRELKAQAVEEDEALTGINPREMQTLLPMTLTTRETKKTNTVDGSMILDLVEERIKTNFFNISEDEKKDYLHLLGLVRKELDESYTRDVIEAQAGDVDRLKGLFNNYLENVKAYCANREILNPLTRQAGPPNERLMNSIEAKMGIDAGKKHEFRHGLMSSIGVMATEGKEFTWDSNDELKNAIVAKVFEDQKDALTPNNDPLIQEMKKKGYNDISARKAIDRVRMLQNR